MSRNDITGDQLITKPASDNYRSGHDRIFCRHDWASDGDPGPDANMTLTCMKCGTVQEAKPTGEQE
jgi:hypothetical protein